MSNHIKSRTHTHTRTHAHTLQKRKWSHETHQCLKVVSLKSSLLILIIRIIGMLEPNIGYGNYGMLSKHLIRWIEWHLVRTSAMMFSHQKANFYHT